jgi:hypothetical protein
VATPRQKDQKTVVKKVAGKKVPAKKSAPKSGKGKK